MKRVVCHYLYFLIPAAFTIVSCEGPMGQTGKDANENCIECHNRQVVETKMIEYEHSRHFAGEAFEEGSRTACAPCHSTQGFLYVTGNKTPANNYVTDATAASLPGRLRCFTCHSNVHTTYTIDDFFPLTWTEPVQMVMWGGTKTLDFPKASSKLCAKCHQPRAVTNQTGAIDYSVLVSSPAVPFTLAQINYRVGVHYGTEAAMNRGEGGIEFGTGYVKDHPHNQAAACATCHMADPQGTTGGHSFVPGFNGCNTTGCHTAMSATNAGYTALITQFNTLLSTLGGQLNAIGAGHDILQRDPVDKQWHGYIDFYDVAANPAGFWGAPGNPPFPSLTNEQFGALINFQLLVRDGSSGIHNPKYMIQLLQNTITALTQ